MKYFRWLLCFPFSIALTFVTWFLSPLLALPIFVTIIDGREWLIKPLRWFQTFDAPLDEFTHGGYGTASSAYTNRIKWLIRNPAYGFAQYPMGIEPTSLPKVTGSICKWDMGFNNWEYTDWGNAFNFRAQWFFTVHWFIRINIGWKYHGGFTRLMLATHITPRKFK
jgi:hypothetical protein